MLSCASRLAAAALVAAAAAPLRAQAPDPARTPINIFRITDNIAMLMGAGGNVGVSIGEDGTLLIDSQFAASTARIFAVLDSIDRRLVRVVINTHWHPDHTGGNANFARAGALVVAHENVRARLASERGVREVGDTMAPAPARGLPTLTFARELTFYFNGDSVRVLHVPRAHTDGDAVVYIRGANVVHMGDVFVTGSYPIIDVASGGSVSGMIAAVDTVLAMTNEHTRIIPGHGALSNRAELTAYRDMLVATRDRVRKAIAAGQGVEAVVAAGLTRDWDGALAQGYVKPADFVEAVYRSVAAEAPPAPAKPAPARAAKPRTKRAGRKP